MTISKYIYKPVMILTAVFCLGLSSCIPDGGDTGGGVDNGSSSDNIKPLPEGVEAKAVGLYSDTGDNLAGLGFTRDGFLTTIVSGYGEWYLSSVGQQPALGNVDYIPTNDWSLQLFPHEGEGFVGYNPQQGFVRFLVAALARNEYREIVGVGLVYLGAFTGYDQPVELKEWSYYFPAEGGSQVAELKGNKYSTYQTFNNASWITTQRTSTTYDFIQDRILIEVEPNPTTEQRQALITLRTASGQESTMRIYQDGLPADEDEEE